MTLAAAAGAAAADACTFISARLAHFPLLPSSQASKPAERHNRLAVYESSRE